MELKTYDPAEISVIIGGAVITGFMDGTFIKCSRNEDAFAIKVGSTGEVTRTKNANRSGRIELTLQQTSESNGILSGFALADELSGDGVVPVLIRDNTGKDLHKTEQAWVVKMPDGGNSKEELGRVWILECGNLQMFLGGN